MTQLGSIIVLTFIYNISAFSTIRKGAGIYKLSDVRSHSFASTSIGATREDNTGMLILDALSVLIKVCSIAYSFETIF
jgi:hypothetical protein